MSKRVSFFVLVLTGLAFALRLPGLFANTFTTDEALFSSWGRLIGGGDALLASQLVDKPPFLFYCQALFYALLGSPAGWVARLPNFVAFVLLVPLVGRLSYQLYGDEMAAVGGVILLALSPFAIQFSASAFTDPLMVALGVASLVAVFGRRPVSAGLLFGLALATKYQAAFFLPLSLLLGVRAAWRGGEWGRWLGAVGAIGLAVGLWQMARPGQSPLLVLQWAQYGGTRLIWSWELWPRLQGWATLSSYFTGSVLFAIPLFLLPLHPRNDRLWLVWLVGYGGLHWLLAIPIWDRYLLPAVPILAVAAGRGLSLLFKKRVTYVVLLGLLLGLGRPAMLAGNGAWPIGASPLADGGAAEIASLLAEAPYGTVLYDHWYSWQWRYYFLHRGVYVSWFYDPAGLVSDLQLFYDSAQARYVVLPNSAESRPVTFALQQAGFSLNLVHRATAMSLYRLSFTGQPTALNKSARQLPTVWHKTFTG